MLSFKLLIPIFLVSLLVDGSSSLKRVPRPDPKVAVLCDLQEKYQYLCQYQYTDKRGKWVNNHTITMHHRDVTPGASNARHSVTYIQESFDYILEYCKKVYPDMNIENIVEAHDYVDIPGWCVPGKGQCHRREWLKPYRCLETPFQSDALLVPKKCAFNHLYNQSECELYEVWNSTAEAYCNFHKMDLRNFAMLMPCGLSLFSGVEFVCCPRAGEKTVDRPHNNTYTTEKVTTPVSYKFVDYDESGQQKKEEKPKTTDFEDEADYDDDDEYYNADFEDKSNPIYPTSKIEADDENIFAETIVRKGSMDRPLLSPPKQIVTSSEKPLELTTYTDEEYAAYKAVRELIKADHIEAVEQAMERWTRLQDYFRQLNTKDLYSSKEFKENITKEFHNILESFVEAQRTKVQQHAVKYFQQMEARANKQKKEAMDCFTDSLNAIPPFAQKVQKCLQKLLKSMYKERRQTVLHYRHLMASDPEQAKQQSCAMLDHLMDIDQVMNQSLNTLESYPSVFGEVHFLLAKYLETLKAQDKVPDMLNGLLPGGYNATCLNNEDSQNQKVLNESPTTDDIIPPIEDKEPKETVTTDKVLGAAQQQYPGMDFIMTENMQIASIINDSSILVGSHEAATEEEHAIQPVLAKSMTHDFAHNEPIYVLKHEAKGGHARDTYLTTLFGTFVVMSVGMIIGMIALIIKNKRRISQNRGFIEVDQEITPEQHITDMQINGYENPTYKYFDIKE